MIAKTINVKLSEVLDGVPVDIIDKVKYYALTESEIKEIMFVLNFIEDERDEYKEMFENSGLFE